MKSNSVMEGNTEEKKESISKNTEDEFRQTWKTKPKISPLFPLPFTKGTTASTTLDKEKKKDDEKDSDSKKTDTQTTVQLYIGLQEK